MQPEDICGAHAQPFARWTAIRAAVVRVPVKAWVVLGLFLIAATFMALHTAVTAKNSSLHLKVQHGFRSGQLYVWVDGEQVYSGKLLGAAKKKFGLLPESIQGNLSEVLSITSGDHELRVRVAADDGTVQEDSIRGNFAKNGQRTLSIVAKHNDITLNWQGTSVALSDSSAPPGAGWLQRYAGSLLITAAGSIISALTGFAIRELPGKIGSRPSSSPKA